MIRNDFCPRSTPCLGLAAGLVAGALALPVWAGISPSAFEEQVELAGDWRFQLDPGDQGITARWFRPEADRSAWRKIGVPHTWQVESGNETYYGAAWYALEVPGDPRWSDHAVRLEFDAVYRDATVWVNGNLIGRHEGSGWTPFGFRVEGPWHEERNHLIVVRVDNRFSEASIPYLDSFDWAADGGILRRVRLRILPRQNIRRILVSAVPDPDLSGADVRARVDLEVEKGQGSALRLESRLYDPSGRLLSRLHSRLEGGETQVLVRQPVEHPRLWHFDSPQLYRLQSRLFDGDELLHAGEVSFGIRRVELRDGLYFLNGEAMRLMGVEWMPGSDPRYGMAEPPEFARSVLRDMKRLNSVVTRFHWQQDDAVFEFCDREGILVQEEIPAWGPRTMEGNLDILQKLQTEETILPHFNHPSIYAWGLCNEIGGQRPEAHRFVRRGIELARALDPFRLLTWASNSLQKTAENDASALVDFVEWNDYWESWYGGSLEDVSANLKRIEAAFPGKSLVVSEYGLCECDPRNPSGDSRRIEILQSHTDLYRKAKNVAGAIFFDYNDYRTHLGDKGQGAFRQRVHGVVDLLGRRKGSWEVLRREASPIRVLSVDTVEPKEGETSASVRILTRSLENDLPAYTLRDYLLIWVAYNRLGQPMVTGKKVLPALKPGTEHREPLRWESFEGLARLAVEVFRPTGYAVLDAEWKAK